MSNIIPNQGDGRPIKSVELLFRIIGIDVAKNSNIVDIQWLFSNEVTEGVRKRELARSIVEHGHEPVSAPWLSGDWHRSDSFRKWRFEADPLSTFRLQGRADQSGTQSVGRRMTEPADRRDVRM